MKNLTAVFLVLLFSLSAYAHPGKTDRRDGHKCWKNCLDWGLESGEYHLHDRERKPVRLGSKTGPVQPPASEQLLPEVPVGEETVDMQYREAPRGLLATNFQEADTKPTPIGKTIDRYISYTHVNEGGFLSFNSLLLLCAVLLLFALIAVRSKRDD